MKTQYLTPVYVDFMPINMEEGKLYISLRYGVAMHFCPCGCKEKVVTPLSENGWTLKYNGKISLFPSIGNYYLGCQSHYFILDNKIDWVSNDYKSSKSKRKAKKKRLKFKRRIPFIFWG